MDINANTTRPLPTTRSHPARPKIRFCDSKRGSVYGYRCEHDKAIADYTEAIRLNPTDAKVYIKRALDYMRKGDRTRAEEISLRPRSRLHGPMKVLFLHGWHSTPGGVEPTYLKDHGHEVLIPALPDDDFDAAIRVAQAEFDQHHPAAGSEKAPVKAGRE